MCKRVALVQPPQPRLVEPMAYQHLGLGYLAAALHREFPSLTVDVLDMSTVSTVDTLEAMFGYDIIGITATSLGFASACQLAQSYKAAQPSSSTVILGGAHATATKIESAPGFDAVFHGDAEMSILRFMHDLDQDTVQPVYSSVPADLDSLAFPKLPLRHGRAAIITSRGCRYRCAYCGNHRRRRLRYRSIENVAEQLRYLRGIGARHIRIWDESFLSDSNRAVSIARLLRDSGASWSVMARADELTSEMAGILARSGCIQVSIGVESFDEAVLAAVHKGHHAADSVRAIECSHAAGLQVNIFMLISTPGETYRHTVDENKRHLDMLRDKLTMVTLSTFMPNPGCDVERDPESFGVEVVSKDYTQYDKHAWVRYGTSIIPAPAWSPIRIQGMTYAQQLENIEAMRGLVSDAMNRGFAMYQHDQSH